MGRGFDFVVIGVIYLVAFIVHLMAIELLAPGSPLHVVASTGTSAMNGAERADLWYEMLAIWVPLLAIGGITAWGFVREYRRQTITAVQGPAP